MRIVFIGAGGHGKVCAEIAELVGYRDILFLDDDRKLYACGKYKTAGIVSDFFKFVDTSTSFFVSIGNAGIRRRIQERIEDAGGRLAMLVHPKAIVSEEVEIGTGTVVMAGAVINAGTTIGAGVIVNTSSSIDHDCKIGDYCHIAVGVHLCGTVEVGMCTWVGAGAVVTNNVNICGNCIIGAGALVIHNIDTPGKYMGVPVKSHSLRNGDRLYRSSGSDDWHLKNC